MKTMRKLLIASLIATGLGSSMAFACGPMGEGRMGHGDMQQRMVERMEQHHKALHDALKLQGDQEAAWNTFVARSKPSAQMLERPKAEDMAKLTTPERLDRMAELSKAHLKAMEERSATTKSFYNSLNAEQKKTFDEFHGAYGMKRGGRGAPAGKGTPPEGKGDPR